MKKFSVIAMVMSLVLIFSTMSSVYFADSNNVDTEKTKIMKELKKLETKYDVVFTKDPDDSLEGTLTLASVEEMESLFTTRSLTVGTPNKRTPPSGFSISTRLTGLSSYVFVFSFP